MGVLAYLYCDDIGNSKNSKSAYNFFYGRHELKKGYLKSERFRCDPECIMEPYFTINNNKSGVPVTEFLENMEKNFDKDMKHAYRVKNYQGIDLNRILQTNCLCYNAVGRQC